MTLALLALGSYLVGSLPIGYLVGRARGVNLFETGSGNIGATNVGRVLGRPWGILVFLLDLLKGVIPVLVGALWDKQSELPMVLAAAAAFLGHLFPAFLGFRGGKGVATGLGTVLVVVPVAALFALAAWILVVLGTRFVSLASVAAVTVLVVMRLIFSEFTMSPATVYCLAGALLVIFKHRGNLIRLFHGNENQIGDGVMRQNLLRILHLAAVGLWFGGAGFFNFVVAPSLNRSYKEVVASAPSDRTAYQPIGDPMPTDESRKQLGSALFGAGVGPIFPKYFMLGAGCGIVVLATAFAWRKEQPFGRARFLIALLALATVLAGWPVSNLVSELRIARFAAEKDIASAAAAAFTTWHLVSLAMSLVTVLLAGVLLVLAAWLPPRRLQG